MVMLYRHPGRLTIRSAFVLSGLFMVLSACGLGGPSRMDPWEGHTALNSLAGLKAGDWAIYQVSGDRRRDPTDQDWQELWTVKKAAPDRFELVVKTVKNWDSSYNPAIRFLRSAGKETEARLIYEAAAGAALVPHAQARPGSDRPDFQPTSKPPPDLVGRSVSVSKDKATVDVEVVYADGLGVFGQNNHVVATVDPALPAMGITTIVATIKERLVATRTSRRSYKLVKSGRADSPPPPLAIMDAPEFKDAVLAEDPFAGITRARARFKVTGRRERRIAKNQHKPEQLTPPPFLEIVLRGQKDGTIEVESFSRKGTRPRAPKGDIPSLPSVRRRPWRVVFQPFLADLRPSTTPGDAGLEDIKEEIEPESATLSETTVTVAGRSVPATLARIKTADGIIEWTLCKASPVGFTELTVKLPHAERHWVLVEDE